MGMGDRRREPALSTLPGTEEFRSARRRMVADEVEAKGIGSREVLRALLEVPRHLFADDALRFQAYGGHALPIGWGQTLSQPYVVGAMTEALELTGEEKVLEVGTGSGYQAAVLSRLAREVRTVERIGELARRARSVLSRLKIRNVHVACRDGSNGWGEHAPYDRILFTAGAESIPAEVLDQLADPGILVAPVGGATQRIVVLRREGGVDRTEDLGACEFVPFITSGEGRIG